MRITAEQAQELVWEESEEFENVTGDPVWDSNGKREHATVIFRTKDGKHYQLELSRTGSYYTEYYYCWEDTAHFDCPEVHQVEKTVTVWEVK